MGRLQTIDEIARFKMEQDFDCAVGPASHSYLNEWLARLRNLLAQDSIRQGNIGHLESPTKGLSNFQARKTWNGINAEPRIPDSFSGLAREFGRRSLLVACEGSQLGPLAVLLSIRKSNFFRLDIADQYAIGKDLIAALNEDESFSPAILSVTLAPLALEGAGTPVADYRLIRATHKEKQCFLSLNGESPTGGQPNTVRRPRLWLVPGTSGHATLARAQKQYPWAEAIDVKTCPNVKKLIHRARNLQRGDVLIAWEPLARWLVSTPNSNLAEIEETSDLHPISLCYHQYAIDPQICNQFNELFWLEWNWLQRNRELAWALVQRHGIPKAFQAQFDPYLDYNGGDSRTGTKMSRTRTTLKPNSDHSQWTTLSQIWSERSDLTLNQRDNIRAWLRYAVKNEPWKLATGKPTGRCRNYYDAQLVARVLQNYPNRMEK